MTVPAALRMGPRACADFAMHVWPSARGEGGRSAEHAEHYSTVSVPSMPAPRWLPTEQ